MRTILLAILFTCAASADVIGTLSLDTSGLVGDPNGPFTLDFQLVENTASLNQVSLSNFQLGGGSLTTAAVSSTGGVTVPTAPFSVLLDSSAFLNDVQFAWTPGAALSFYIDATAFDDPLGPDTFTFAILDGNGVEVPTTNSFFDVFAELDTPGGGAPADAVFSGTDSTRTTTSVATPQFTAATPEPPGWAFGATLLAAIAIVRRWRARSAAAGNYCPK
jgi:hypothetical protein